MVPEKKLACLLKIDKLSFYFCYPKMVQIWYPPPKSVGFISEMRKLRRPSRLTLLGYIAIAKINDDIFFPSSHAREKP